MSSNRGKKEAFIPPKGNGRPSAGRTTPFRKPRALSSVLRDKLDSETLRAHLKQQLDNHNAVIDTAGATALSLGIAYVSSRIIPTDEGFDSYQKSYLYKEDDRIGSEMGSIYKKYLKIVLGDKTSTQLKRAKELYKVQNWPAFDSESTKYWRNESLGVNVATESLYAQAGEMRQGVWFPNNYGPHLSDPSNNFDKAMGQMYSGRLLTKMAMYSEIRKYLMTDEDRAWLDSTSTQSADKYYAIDYIEDQVTIANGMEYSPVDLKIYLCKCKSSTQYSPAACWFDPRGTEITGSTLMRHLYVYPSSQVSSNLPGTDFSGLTAATHYPDANVHVGATPYYSSQFRNHWDVEDVIKVPGLLPTDKFELTLKRHLKNATSVKDLEGEYDFTSSGGRGAFCEGDYALIICFKGKPAFMHYTGTLTSGQVGVRETEVGPSKIMVNSRSSFGIASPNLIDSSNQPTGLSQTSNYIAGEGRVLDLDIKTLPFSNSDWIPTVITGVNIKDGGERQ